MQRGVVLIQKDVDRFVVGALEPGGEIFNGLGAILIRAVSVQYSGKQFFIGFAQHTAVLQILVSLVFRREHFPDDPHAFRVRRSLGILETQVYHRMLSHVFAVLGVFRDGHVAE